GRIGCWKIMATALVVRTRVRAQEEIRACYARDFSGLQLIHTVADANKVLNVAPKKSRKSREPAFTVTMLAYWPRYFSTKITGLIETASTKYCSSVREKAEIG